MSIKVHPIRTGAVRIKTAQKNRQLGGLLRVLTDSSWTVWLPILSWIVEHPEGYILIDTGETSNTRSPGYFPRWHPYFAGCIQTNVNPEDEIGYRLNRMGIDKRDIKCIVLTHLHTDHAGGLYYFPHTDIWTSKAEYVRASGISGRILGYLPQRWPEWFAPKTISFDENPLGPFSRTHQLTDAGDIVIVPTPGHTPGHVSVVVKTEECNYFLAGDTSYNQQLLMQKRADGVSPNVEVTKTTLQKILDLAAIHPMVYLPSHDQESVDRLKRRQPLFHDIPNLLAASF
jgi:glyoxylase-like metal-dependent hydrolase (beta-lactamase superfamily II)